MSHTGPVCPGVLLGDRYHLKSAADPAAGLQQAKRKVTPSVMSPEGLADTATAPGESGEQIGWFEFITLLTGSSLIRCFRGDNGGGSPQQELNF